MTEPRDAAKVQDALYRIAELAGAAQDMQEFYRKVHSIVGELMYADNFFISLYDEERQLINFPYYIDEIDDDIPDPNVWDAFGEGNARGFNAYVLRTGKPQFIPHERLLELIEQGEVELLGVMTEHSSWIGAPLLAEGKAVGVLVVQSYTREHQYTEDDLDLLAFVAQHVGAALSRARAIEETRQRNAELALINSVQSALAGELELQAIYDVVGDKIQEVFDAQVVDIGIYDEASGLFHFPYTIELGVRYPDEPLGLIGFRKYVMETGEPLLIAEDNAAMAVRYGNPLVLTGKPPKSALFVPLTAGGKATGVISLQNVDREHAFADTDQRLLVTLAGSLSVALDNARLVHETRQRNAELALINSVQQAIAGELDPQAIYEIVGERIRDVFDAQSAGIAMVDEATGQLVFMYAIEHGERLEIDPMPVIGFRKHVLETRKPLMINENVVEAAEQYGNPLVLAGHTPKSAVFVPLVAGGKPTGVISLQNIDREHAFSDSDLRLLVTLAGSLSVALDNARLVHETRQRNAELALINSVQQAIAGELDPQAIYDIVGDRIRDVFDAQTVIISMLDETTGQIASPYMIERGERLEMVPSQVGFSKHVLETREPLMINEDVAGESARKGIEVQITGEAPKSVLFVPLFAGGRATGVISLQNVDREHAFTETDERLLVTLAGSLSVALDNARLIHETRQRNAELALINSVQESIAGELDQQAIYDLVGDRVQEVFDAQVVVISMIDEASGLLVSPYVIERGKRLEIEPMPVMGFREHVLESREPLMINDEWTSAADRHGNPPVLVGEVPQSGLFVPLFAGGRATGVISLQNVDREHAFSDADERLLVTFAGSLSVALENARLVHETRQRNAELALINGVQQAIAGELEPQAIYDIVGDKIQQVFDAQVVDIAVYDEPSGLLHFPYVFERGERLGDDPIEMTPFRQFVLDREEPLLVNENIVGFAEEHGVQTIGEAARSALWVPVALGSSGRGWISLQNLDREHAFTDSDVQLLGTLAGSLGVALENARLLHETRQRNAELALINSVQAAIAGELDSQAIYDIVGDKIQEVFDAQVVDIGLYDEASGLIDFPYTIERGVRIEEESGAVPLTPFRSRVLESKEPIVVNDNMLAFVEEWGIETIGEPSRSALWVPLAAGSGGRGWISLQNLDREHAFSDSDIQLLSTLAGGLGVALDNARLVHETRQRNAELGADQ